METIKGVLIQRDNMTEKEADNLIEMARKAMHERIAAGEMPHNICAEWFGLEPDYIWDLI